MFDLDLPTRLDQALELLVDEGAKPLGGGTATALLLKQNLIHPKRIVALRRIAELHGLRDLPDGGLAIGACTTVRELAGLSGYPSLAFAAANVGNVRVRSVATVGGAVAHGDPCQDLPPVLLTLGARLVTDRRTLPLDGFYTDYMETALQPGEIVLRVELPPPSAAARSVYVKFTPRSLDDYATVGIACRLELDAAGVCTDVAVAFAGVGSTAILTHGPHAALVGQRPSSECLAAAAEAAVAEIEPWDDLRGSAAYKRAMARLWTQRALEGLVSARPAGGR